MTNPRVQDQDIEFKGKYRSEVFQTLYFGYKPFMKKIVFVLILGLLGRALLLGNANLIGYWVDSLCFGNSNWVGECRNLPTALADFESHQFLILLTTFAAVGFLFTLIFRVAFSRLSAYAVSQIYDETTFRTSRMPMVFFDTTPTGRIITRFSSDYGNVFRLFGGPLAEFVSIIFDLICMVILISVASPFYLIPIAGMAVANFFVYSWNKDRLRETRRQLSRSRSPSIAHFAETAQGASTIRSFLKEDSFAKRFFRLENEYIQQRLKNLKVLTGFGLQMGTLTAATLLFTGVMAWILLKEGLLSVGSIGVAFGFIVLSGGTIQMFFEWLAQFEEAMVGLERLDHYLRLPLEKDSRLPTKSLFETGHDKYSDIEEKQRFEFNSKKPKNISVKFENVWFRYQKELPWILQDLSFQIEAGQRVGLIGRTGSGKSSVVQALFRFYQPDRGQILIGDKAISDYDLSIYRDHIAFISQDSILFKGTLRENLDLCCKKSDEALIEALERVGLQHLATIEGLESLIEERGRNLSHGEKQLICIARCLLQEAPLVIMDEATSSIDPQSEEILTSATDEFFQGKTQLIIAHRLSTLEKCDLVFWLEQGRIRRSGPPSEILPEFEKASHNLSK
jgi:ABC-type multidrug transport system fused ATPase/permease subunit